MAWHKAADSCHLATADKPRPRIDEARSAIYDLVGHLKDKLAFGMPPSANFAMEVNPEGAGPPCTERRQCQRGGILLLKSSCQDYLPPFLDTPPTNKIRPVILHENVGRGCFYSGDNRDPTSCKLTAMVGTACSRMLCMSHGNVGAE